jgi:hypothetical protein
MVEVEVEEEVDVASVCLHGGAPVALSVPEPVVVTVNVCMIGTGGLMFL